MSNPTFLICETCGNLIGMIECSECTPSCCGKPMVELKANVTDAAQEKHVPVVEVSGDKCKITIGADAHPMTEEHQIVWVYLKTEKGGQRKTLKAGEQPSVVFSVVDDKPLAAYAYCNLHGLWMAEI